MSSHRGGSRSRSPQRGRSPQRRGGEASEPDTAWLQISDLPPKSNWSSLRRLVTGAGGTVLSGRVYPHRSLAVAMLGSREEALEVAKKVETSELSGKRVKAEVISHEERQRLDA